MSKSKRAFLVLLVLVTALVTACSGNSNRNNTGEARNTPANEKKVLKVGHTLPEGNVIHQSLLVFNEELEKRTNGRYSLQIFPQATLGNEDDLFQQTQVGILDMSTIGTDLIANYSDDFYAWYLPNLMKNHQDAFAIAALPETKKLFDSVENIEMLGHWFSGLFYAATKEPFTKLSDIQGKKIRVKPSSAILEWWNFLGASPTPIPLAEVYTALETGVIDGLVTDLEIILAFSIYEITGHFTQVPEIIPTAVIINQPFWNSLSPEDQQHFRDAMKVATEFSYSVNLEREASNLAKLKEAGGQVHEFAEKDLFEEKSKAYREKLLNNNETIKAFYEAAVKATR